MSAPAWMPLYVADYLADTGHLSAAESGAYLHLIMHYWQKGGLPDDDRLLARLARMTADEWSEARQILAPLFGPKWTHKRIDLELAKAARIRAKRSVAGKASAEARLNNGSTHVEHDHQQMSVGGGEGNNLDTTQTEKKGASTREDAVSVLSQTLDLERAQAVVEHRKRLRKPLTDHAAKLLAKKFAKCPSPNEAADAMIANGWQGFEPDWLENRRSQGPPTKDGWLELNRELNGYGNGPHDDRNQKALPTPAGGVTLDIEAEEPGGAR